MRAPTVCFSKSLRAGLQWLQAAGGAKHHDRRILLVFRRRRHLFLGQLERDAVALVGNAPEMQRVPVDHDFPAADAEKTAEIDDGRAHRSGPIDDHVDDAAHVLVGRAANLAAEHAMCISCADEVATADVAKAATIKMNWRLARIRPPELLRPDGLRPKSRARAQISAPERSKPGFGRVYA